MLYSTLKSISDVVIKFSERFKEKKKAKNLVDFSDMVDTDDLWSLLSDIKDKQVIL